MTADELEAAAESLRQTAWLLGEFWRACHDAGLPEALAVELVSDYHRDWILAWGEGVDDTDTA